MHVGKLVAAPTAAVVSVTSVRTGRREVGTGFKDDTNR